MDLIKKFPDTRTNKIYTCLIPPSKWHLRFLGRVLGPGTGFIYVTGPNGSKHVTEYRLIRKQTMSFCTSLIADVVYTNPLEVKISVTSGAPLLISELIGYILCHKKVCNCDIKLLMARGCKCGGI